MTERGREGWEEDRERAIEKTRERERERERTSFLLDRQSMHYYGIVNDKCKDC